MLLPIHDSSFAVDPSQDVRAMRSGDLWDKLRTWVALQ